MLKNRVLRNPNTISESCTTVNSRLAGYPKRSNVSLTIKYSILLCLGIQGIVASDVSNKRESIIIQATKLLPPLAALINAYHGPAYYKGFCKESCPEAPFDTNLYHSPRSCFGVKKNDPCLYIHRFYKSKDEEDIAAHGFNELFTKKGVPHSNPMTIRARLDDGNIQFIARMLARQKAITNATRQAHPEIPFSNDPRVAVCEFNKNVIVVASADNSMEVWPLDWDDVDPFSQEKPLCSDAPSIDNYDKHATQTSQLIPAPCQPLLAEAEPEFAMAQRATACPQQPKPESVDILPVRIASCCVIS